MSWSGDQKDYGGQQAGGKFVNAPGVVEIAVVVSPIHVGVKNDLAPSKSEHVISILHQFEN